MGAQRTIKGSSVSITVERVRKLHGEAGLARLVEALPSDVRGELPADMRFLPASTWSFELWAELLLSADQLFGKFARASSRDGYRQLLRTAYKNWVRPGDAEASVRRLPYLWEQVTKGLGHYEVIDRNGNIVIRVTLHDVPDRYRDVVEERVAGTVEAMIAASGRRGTVKRLPHDRESGVTEYVVRTTRSLVDIQPP